MALYAYVKTYPSQKGERLTAFWHFFSISLVVIGGVFLANALLPILQYEIKSGRFNQEMIAPVVLGETVEEKEIDYTNPHNWFPTAPQLPVRPSKITHYTLSIPELNIEEAVVQIGGEDLMASLIHYPGTALPGQFGNAVIFGHSVLPQFFNPKNYKTIFSTLPKLKEGDEILVSFDGVLYRYQVVRMVETSPQDVTVLEQRYDNSYLSLITCVPPGTYLKRLVVVTRLVAI